MSLYSRINLKGKSSSKNSNMFLNEDRIKDALLLISKDKKGSYSAVENGGNFYIIRELNATFEFIGRIEYKSEVNEIAKLLGIKKFKAV